MISQSSAGETSLRHHLKVPNASKRLDKNVGQKVRKKFCKSEAEEENDTAAGISFRCLTLYGRSGGCKVGADATDDFGDMVGKRRSNASEEGKVYNTICGTEETTVDCFAYGVKDKFWKKTSKKILEFKQSQTTSGMHVFLPDDILEMCLMRLPLTSLMTARLVCKKWRNMTRSSRFMQMRRQGLYQTPWLFVFGVIKDGFCSGEMHAFDVSFNQWHKIDAQVLKGRFMFSVASIQDDVYVIGGCSSLNNFGKMDRSSYKTHKGVVVFSPLTKSWRKAASMKYARSAPILGTYEISSDCSIVKNHHIRQERRFIRSRVGGVSDVYEDPHRLSVRRQVRSSLDENEVSFFSSMKPNKFVRPKSDHSSAKACRRFVLIAVGGVGNWDEPLDSGEIYDSSSNKWMEFKDCL